MTRSIRTILHVFSTLEIGGPQIRFAQLVNHFGRKYRHLVLAMDGVTEALAHVTDDVDVRLIEAPVRKGHGIGVAVENVRGFRRILRSVRPDLLVTANWGTVEWALANLDGRAAHLHLEDGFGPEEASRQIARRVWARRLLLRRSTVLVPSQTLYRIARDTWRLPEQRLLYVPNGVDCDRFGIPYDGEFAAALGIQAGVPVIGTVTGLRAEKNLGRLLDAFALVARERPARLVIVGDGPERGELAARAERLGVQASVVMTGACATPERLLPRFDVYAVSSDTEQMPLSVLEAMAAGRPLAATDVGDIRMMVDPENHPFLVARDAAALARAMSALIDNPDTAAAVGAANARRARMVFDKQFMFSAYRRLFDGQLPDNRLRDRSLADAQRWGGSSSNTG
jgi:glycosyltransferase involved in cell wall biosynthesis